jgi:predicted Ser/Thr protein kinase
MRCSNCGARIADAVAATTDECPKCKRALRPGEEAVTSASTKHATDATEPYLRSVPVEDKEGSGDVRKPPGKKRPTDSGSQRRAGGAYTARFDLDDVAVKVSETPSATGEKAGTTQEAGAPSKEAPRHEATTSIKSAKTGADIPSKLGHFKVKGELGQGGMGAVLDGYDPQLDRRVALKVLSAKLATDEQFVHRFLSEARAVARVSHPNVAGIYFADSDNGRHFFAMEFIEGESLDKVVDKGGRLTPKVAVGYVIQAVRGLAAAHERGIVHRDIKPANLMLSKDNVIKVTDFGLAKLSGENVKLTQAGSVMGSPHFMAPEQGRGEETDVRADVYSLGATLYYLLTGETPYDGDSAVAVILKHQEAPVPQLGRAPPSVNRLLGRMMAKGPGGRYQSYANLMTDLIRLDKSGLLRDDVTLEAGAAAMPAAPPPGSGSVSRGSGAPGKRGTTVETVQTDEQAALLSRLDATMKRAPGVPAGTRGLTGQRLRAAAANVTSRILRPSEAAEKEEAEGQDGMDVLRSLPLGRIAAVALSVIALLIVISLKPWSWVGTGTDSSSTSAESETVLEAIEGLREPLAHEAPDVRRDALVALGGYPGPTATALIVSKLNDPDSAVRAEAAKVLGETGREGVEWKLVRLLSDESPEAREAAAQALVKLTGYVRLARIDWRESPEGLRRAILDEFTAWLRGGAK